MEEAGINRLILEKYNSGSMIIGLSAGGMQLGHKLYHNSKSTAFSDPNANLLAPAIGIVPVVFGMHEDGKRGGNWADFESKLRNSVLSQNFRSFN